MFTAAQIAKELDGEVIGDWASAGIDNVQVSIMSLGGGLVMWGRKAPGSPQTEDRRPRDGAAALATSG